MNTNVVITQDRRRARKDGSYPIIYRLSHNHLTITISSGYAVPENAWDGKYHKIRPGYKGIENVTRVNNLLQKTRSQYMDVITQLKDKGEISFLSINDIKERLVQAPSDLTFFDYTQKQIDAQKKQGRLGNARSYENTLREVKNFRKEKDISFTSLNYSFLKKFEASYLNRGLSENGLAVHMRTIRAIYNKAIKDKVVEKEAYPFERYSIKTKPTKKRAISLGAIQKIVALTFEEDNPLFDARNMFLMSFYLMGAPFVDLVFLKRSNIIDGRVQYKRQKTGRFYDIKIFENLMPIMNYYLKDKKPDEFLLPVIKREKPSDQYKDFLWAQKRYNKRLKEIAKLAGIEEKLTSYVSRHSFASIANNMAIPVTAISEMLGHQKLTTTQVYLAGLSKDTIDSYNEKIISGG